MVFNASIEKTITNPINRYSYRPVFRKIPLIQRIVIDSNIQFGYTAI